MGLREYVVNVFAAKVRGYVDAVLTSKGMEKVIEEAVSAGFKASPRWQEVQHELARFSRGIARLRGAVEERKRVSKADEGEAGRDYVGLLLYEMENAVYRQSQDCMRAGDPDLVGVLRAFVRDKMEQGEARTLYWNLVIGEEAPKA